MALVAGAAPPAEATTVVAATAGRARRQASSRPQVRLWWLALGAVGGGRRARLRLAGRRAHLEPVSDRHRRPGRRLPRRPHRDGRRRAHDADPHPALRLPADARDRHRHRLRGDHQGLRLVASPATAAPSTCPLALWLAAGQRAQRPPRRHGRARDEPAGATPSTPCSTASIGVALVLVAILLVVRIVMKAPVATRTTEPAALVASQGARRSAIGATTGFIIGLTSVGSGTLLAMFLILFYPIAVEPHRRHRRLSRHDPARPRRVSPSSTTATSTSGWSPRC